MDADFTAFVAGRAPALSRLAFLLTADEAAADDLLQTALLRSYLRWRKVREHPEAYVRGCWSRWLSTSGGDPGGVSSLGRGCRKLRTRGTRPRVSMSWMPCSGCWLGYRHVFVFALAGGLDCHGARYDVTLGPNGDDNAVPSGEMVIC